MQTRVNESLKEEKIAKLWNIVKAGYRLIVRLVICCRGGFQPQSKEQV